MYSPAFLALLCHAIDPDIQLGLATQFAQVYFRLLALGGECMPIIQLDQNLLFPGPNFRPMHRKIGFR